MSRSTPRLRTVATVLVALVLIAGLVAPAAFAHARLLGSDPQQGATLPTTDQVVLTFNEDINPDFVQVVLTGPDGEIALDEAVIAGPLLTQAISPTSSGAYTVTYRIVSEDGHPVAGALAFTLTDVPPPVTAESTPEVPTTPDQPTVMSGEVAVTTATDAADPAVDESGATLAPFVWLAVAAVIAALAGAGVWLARQRRHPEH